MHETIPEARVEGRVLIGNMDIYDTSAVEVRRRVGMVFQEAQPIPAMSIYDNVAAGLKLSGFHHRAELDEIVEHSLRMAALWDEVKDKLRKQSGAGLSGGQQQRLCIAAPSPCSPDVLLMDEPAPPSIPSPPPRSKNSSSSSRRSNTIVIVTHNMQQAARVADRTAFFLMGKLVEFDRTETIFTLPHDKRTERLHYWKFG